MSHDTEARISLHPHHGRVQVRIDETLVADTTRAMELRERGYPPRRYIPREDVRMDLLAPSETVTHCPFKGDACYWSFDGHRDVAWSYEQPTREVAAIKGAVAFYADS